MRKKGFTAIEVTMIVMVLVILGSMVVPRYLDMQKNTEKAVASDFLEVLKQAQAQHKDARNFTDFVADHPSSDGQEENKIFIDSSLRQIFMDANARVVHADRITMTFESGASVVYTMAGNGEINANFIGF